MDYLLKLIKLWHHLHFYSLKGISNKLKIHNCQGAIITIVQTPNTPLVDKKTADSKVSWTKYNWFCLKEKIYISKFCIHPSTSKKALKLLSQIEFQPS